MNQQDTTTVPDHSGTLLGGDYSSQIVFLRTQCAAFQTKEDIDEHTWRNALLSIRCKLHMYKGIPIEELESMLKFIEDVENNTIRALYHEPAKFVKT